MIAIDSVPSPKIETWMVDMLFGQQGQAASAVGAAPPAPSVAVTSGARSAVAAGTGQAIAGLPAGGGDGSIREEGDGPKLMTVRQINGQIAANNAMTTAEISAALYSGVGLPRADNMLQSPTETFTAAMQMSISGDLITLAEIERGVTKRATQQPELWKSRIESSLAVYNSMQNAFDRHQMTIQKLSDVEGLHYVGHAIFGGDPDSAPSSGSWTENYDKQAMKDLDASFTGARHSVIMPIGQVQLLLTWTDDSIQGWK